MSASMRSCSLLLLLSADAAALLLPATASRVRTPTMGLFDELGKMVGGAFSNEDYSQSAAQYEQTNARASHILVGNEDTALDIKAKLASGELLFDEAAMKFSTCNSASSGGKLGKFSPGTMVAEFDQIVFGMTDTGEMDMGNGAYIFEPTYALDEVHGPVQTKFGYHLIKITQRNVAKFDFRGKEGVYDSRASLNEN